MPRAVFTLNSLYNADIHWARSKGCPIPTKLTDDGPSLITTIYSTTSVPALPKPRIC